MKNTERCSNLNCNGKMILQPSFYTYNGVMYQFKKCKKCEKEVQVLEIFPKK